MAGTADGTVVLLPIKPRYAMQIMDGSKLVEFRRRPFGRAPEWVVVYASAPVQRVLGAFRIGHVDTASPAILWHRYGNVGGIDLSDYEVYFGARDTGVALCVDTVLSLNRPLRLTELDASLRAPQSFRYLHSDVLAAVLGADHPCPARTEPLSAQ